MEKCDVLLAQSDQRPLDLLHRTAFGGRDPALVTLQELSKRGASEYLRIRRSSEAIDCGLELARPLLSFNLAVEGLAAGLYAAPANLRLPASSELPDRRM